LPVIFAIYCGSLLYFTKLLSVGFTALNMCIFID
jgi:hypothetical protein